jgi:hypothetical protein
MKRYSLSQKDLYKIMEDLNEIGVKVEEGTYNGGKKYLHVQGNKIEVLIEPKCAILYLLGKDLTNIDNIDKMLIKYISNEFPLPISKKEIIMLLTSSSLLLVLYILSRMK